MRFLFLFLCCWVLVVSAKNVPMCDGAKETPCQTMLMSLHPTQPNVGFYEVGVNQLPDLLALLPSCLAASDKKSCYDDALQTFLASSSNQLGVVYGYDKQYYIVDGHHHGYALWKVYQQAGLCTQTSCDIPVVVTILQDYSNAGGASNFWSLMAVNNLYWPYAYSAPDNQYVYYPYTNLPKTVANLRMILIAVFLVWRVSGVDIKPAGFDANFYQFKWAACLLSQFNFPAVTTPVDYTALILNARDALYQNIAHVGKMHWCRVSEYADTRDRLAVIGAILNLLRPFAGIDGRWSN